MIPMETACNFVKPKARARARVKKIPNCPAAPRRKIFGFSRRGPKSVMEVYLKGNAPYTGGLLGESARGCHISWFYGQQDGTSFYLCEAVKDA
jgi:hypothetical protein